MAYAIKYLRLAIAYHDSYHTCPVFAFKLDLSQTGIENIQLRLCIHTS